MINLSLNVVFKKKSVELKREIQTAINKTRELLFEYYSGGVEIDKDEITAGKNTIQLAFCKCFDKNTVENINSYTDFISESYQLWIDSHQRIGKSELVNVLPDPTIKLTALQIRPVLKGLGLMLFILWSQDAIILTPKYKMVTVKKNRGNINSNEILADKYATEILSYFLSFRKGLNRDKNKATLLEIHEELTPSLQNNLQSYGWRFLVSTDWHVVERVNPKEALDFLDRINKHRRGEIEFDNIPVPLKSMLHMLQEKFPNRISYDLQSMDFKIDAVKKQFKYANASPENIAKFNENNSEVIYFNNAPEKVKYWVELEKKYINLRKKKGYISSKADHKFLAVLNYYLFVKIPEFQQEKNQPIFIPSPVEYTRQIFEGTENIPGFIDWLGNDRDATSLSNILRQIDLFFDYIEAIADSSEHSKNFKNPIHRAIDFPLTHRRPGTTKKTISQLHSPTLLSYVYAVYDFSWFIYQSILSDKTLQDKISSKYRSIGYEHDYIDTSEMGYVPFVIYREKVYPLLKIHKSLLNLTRRYPDGSHKESINLPNMAYLSQFLVAFETGIRNVHIRWLDREMYDKEIDRSKPLSPICPLLVNTDKVKKNSWISWVSSRVIKILDRLKLIAEGINEPWLDSSYYYECHEETCYEKIKPIFAKGGFNKEGGKPYSDTSYSKAFVKILYFFQDFCNTLSVFSETIDIVDIQKSEGKNRPDLSSDVTPHSSRATLVSNYIKILPPSVIGQYCTGHESDAVVSYYTVIDAAYINNASNSQALSINGQHPLLNRQNDAVSIQAENAMSLLREAIGNNIVDAFSDFGAVSFELDGNHHQTTKSGINIAIENKSTDQISFNSTHLCPYNNLCPDDVVQTTGVKNCGQCYASIKTVDHLPRILAHIRSLQSIINEKTNYLKNLLKNNDVSESVLNKLENDRNELAKEESAWIATHAILENLRKDIATRNRYLIKRPEIIEKHIELVATEDSPLANILNRIRDAKMYPEYFTPQLESQIVKLRNKILAQNGDIERLINQPDDYVLLDEFRGIIRSVCDASNKSIEEIYKVMNSELPDENTATALLEIK